jgi:hypothetical protein
MFGICVGGRLQKKYANCDKNQECKLLPLLRTGYDINISRLSAHQEHQDNPHNNHAITVDTDKILQLK